MITKYFVFGAKINLTACQEALIFSFAYVLCIFYSCALIISLLWLCNCPFVKWCIECCVVSKDHKEIHKKVDVRGTIVAIDDEAATKVASPPLQVSKQLANCENLLRDAIRPSTLMTARKGLVMVLAPNTPARQLTTRVRINRARSSLNELIN